jgi:hypothetical protein
MTFGHSWSVVTWLVDLSLRQSVSYSEGHSISQSVDLPES